MSQDPAFLRQLLLDSAAEVRASEQLTGVPSEASLWHLSNALAEVFTYIGFAPDEIPDAVKLLIHAPEAQR